MAFDHRKVLRELREVAETSTTKGQMWRKAIGSNSLKGGSNNYDKMAIGIVEALERKAPTGDLGDYRYASARARVAREVAGELPFNLREPCSVPYEEWSLNGMMVAKFHAKGAGGEVYRRWIRRAAVLWAFTAVPETKQQRDAKGNPTVKTPGGYPAGMRSGPYRKYREYAANYSYAKLLRFDGSKVWQKSRKKRLVEVLEARRPGFFASILSDEEAASLRRIVFGSANHADYRFAMDVIKDVRFVAKYMVERDGVVVPRVRTYFPQGAPSHNTANLFYSEVTSSGPINSPWPYSQDRVRQSKEPSSVWQREVVRTRVSMLVEALKVETPHASILGRIGHSPAVRLTLWPKSTPTLELRGEQVYPPRAAVVPGVLPGQPSSERKGFWEKIWELLGL